MTATGIRKFIHENTTKISKLENQLLKITEILNKKESQDLNSSNQNKIPEEKQSLTFDHDKKQLNQFITSITDYENFRQRISIYVNQELLDFDLNQDKIVDSVTKFIFCKSTRSINHHYFEALFLIKDKYYGYFHNGVEYDDDIFVIAENLEILNIHLNQLNHSLIKQKLSDLEDRVNYLDKYISDIPDILNTLENIEELLQKKN